MEAGHLWLTDFNVPYYNEFIFQPTEVENIDRCSKSNIAEYRL